MNQYVKKPIPVSALQWKGNNLEEIKSFCTDSNGYVKCFVSAERLWINTKEGQIKTVIGDYVIRGIDGFIFTCEQQIFNNTYDNFNEKNNSL